MKEILDEESKNALINYRIQRAYETLKEAQVMMRESFYNAAVNRLYYACYYAAVSLLLKYDHQPQTHNGVKTMLGLHFISTGKLPIKIGKYSRLYLRKDIVEIMTILFIVIRKCWITYIHKPNYSFIQSTNY